MQDIRLMGYYFLLMQLYILQLNPPWELSNFLKLKKIGKKWKIKIKHYLILNNTDVPSVVGIAGVEKNDYSNWNSTLALCRYNEILDISLGTHLFLVIKHKLKPLLRANL